MKKFLVGIGLMAFGGVVWGQDLNGRWDGAVEVNGLRIPFQFEVATKDGSLQGTFFNGKERFGSTEGSFDGKTLVLDFGYFGTKLKAQYEDGKLKGEYGRPKRLYAFEAEVAKPRVVGKKAPEIGGVWEIEAESAKGEKAWRLVLEQDGDWAKGAILRIDGDTGELSGEFAEGKFVMSHFSGTRPALLEVTPREDGTLELELNRKSKYVARRPEDARAAGLTAPLEAQKFTSVKDPKEPLRFSAPDLNGKLVTESDDRFRGKVVLVNVMGSWCPNCHDEAPFLVEIYRKYREQGLEVVALDFEDAEELENPERLRAFLKRHGVEYTVLLAGETSTAREKLKQAENWNAWPTTFFVGRDGLVKGAHAGFPSAASRELYEAAKRDFVAMVEKLLQEQLVSSR